MLIQVFSVFGASSEVEEGNFVLSNILFSVICRAARHGVEYHGVLDALQAQISFFRP